MYPLLYKYFLVNKKLVFPGIGHFILQDTPASLDFVKGILRAPQSKILFAPIDANQEDSNLFLYLKKEMRLDEWQVVEQFKSFVSTLKYNIEDYKLVELPGIGKLQKGSSEQEIVFTPTTSLGLTAVADIKLSNTNDTRANLVELYTTGENLILTEETEEDKLEMIVKQKDEDYWWVYALILSLFGVGALLYYYI